MYLKKLVMENFKSFRGRVVVPFPRGFTGITGPNGSGKSNIADAILFIIGKSSRALRAQRQTDLIFNGGPNGRPANRCSVEVVFDNTDRLIPFDADEVHFTKVVKRKPASGDQEEKYSTSYYLNGRRVTASEFERLFSSSRISTDAYNIIQQGDVNHLVDMGPTERRRVLEAISGIATFDAEINRAMEQKLKAEDKLEKILEKKKEIEQEVRRLKSSAEKALKFKELKGELKRTRMEALVKELYLLLKEIEEKKNQITRNTAEKSGLEEKLPDVERRIQEAAERIEEIDEEIARMGGEEVRRIKERLENARREYFEVKARIERAQDAMESEERALKDLRKRLKDLREFVKGLGGEEKTLSERLETLQKDLEGVAVEIKKREESQETGNRELRETTFRIKEVSEKISDLKTRLATLEERLKGAETTFGEVQRRVEEVEEEIETEKYEIKRARLTLKEIRKRAKEIEKLNEHRDRLMTLKGRERELRERVEKVGEKLRKLDARLREKELSGGLDGRRRAVMEVLSYRDRGEIEGILGTVGELMSVPKEYERAILAAAGGYIHAIVVEDDSVMEKVSRKLKENRVGRVHLIPLNKVMMGKPRAKALMIEDEPDVVGFALELIEYDERFRKAFWYVFRDTLVVKDMKALRRHMGGVKLVTLEGEWADPGGGAEVGYLPPSSIKDLNIFRATREVAKIREEMEALKGEKDALIEEHQSVSREISNLEREIERILGVREGLEGQLRMAEEEVRRHEKSLKELEGEREELMKRRDELSGELAKLKEEIKGLRESVGRMEEEKTELEERAKKLLPKRLKVELERLRTKEKELREEIAPLEREVTKVRTQIEGAEVEIKRIKGEIPVREGSIEELKREMKKYEEELEKKERAVKALDEMMEKMTEKQKDLYERKHEWERSLTELEGRRRDMKDRIAVIENVILDLRRGIREVEKRAERVREDLIRYQGWEEIQPDELPSLDELQRRAREIEESIERMGDINMEAVEEYERKGEALKKLKKRLETLKEERRHLQKLIDDTTKRKIERFMETYESVDRNFQELFSMLTGGGKARLSLDNPEDPFQGGLNIWAQPPGKKVQRVEALSGGEKAITAISFILAVQRYDPSPFYFFDEIDQNLDPINAEKVARLIKRNSERAQFIVISLRKVTLKEAESLIGVLPRPEGTSNIIMKMNLEEVRPEWESQAEEKAKASQGGGENV